MNRSAKLTQAAALVLEVTVLAGCNAAAPEPSASPAAVDKSAPANAETYPSAPPEAEPTAPAPPVSDEQLTYEAEIASWPETLPDGYIWPTWDEMPHIGSDQLAAADNASGVYRCILLDAAWHAYFEDNDAVASKDYAVRADSYAIPDNPSLTTVTENGAIIDAELAASNGICRGISGDLR